MLETVVLFRINPLTNTVEQFRPDFSWRVRKRLGFHLSQTIKSLVEGVEWGEDFYANQAYHAGGEDALEKHIEQHYRHYFWVLLDFDYTIRNTGVRKPRTPKAST